MIIAIVLRNRGVANCLKFGAGFATTLLKAIIIAALWRVPSHIKGVFDKIIGDMLPKGAEISCVGREWVTGHWPFRQPEAPPVIFRMSG